MILTRNSISQQKIIKINFIWPTTAHDASLFTIEAALSL